MCFSPYKNCELKVKLWWVGAREGKKSAFFIMFILPKANFFNIWVLFQCIVHWINFQNIHIFYIENYVIHFCCLFLKWSKAFSVSLSKNGTTQLTKNFSQSLKPNWLCNFNDSAANKISNFASVKNTSNVSLIERLKITNPKNIIFSYININSTRNKFDHLCDLIFKKVDILSVAETKLDPSFPNLQSLIPGYHEAMRLDTTRKRDGMLFYIKS